MTNSEPVPFNFTSQALKLLGRSLYSNPWTAISELVANGFDAGARTIWVLLDVVDNTNARLEILDDGEGMDDQTLENYVTVGWNKRAATGYSERDIPTMGRKGIGKLAALYLSDSYNLSTKTGDDSSNWSMTLDPSEQARDSAPMLQPTRTVSDGLLRSKYEDLSSGTYITIRNIDLKGFGEGSYKALSRKLADHFLLSAMPRRSIKIHFKTSQSTPLQFVEVEKNVAFNNFVMLYENYATEDLIPKELQELEDGRDVTFRFTKDGSQILKLRKGQFGDIADGDRKISGSIPLEDTYGVVRDFPYELNGWLGLHASINLNVAQLNDARFVKNRFYNPSQIRLYVNNKLANENIINSLGITQAFANYIEGELSFNILDHSELADIATTNRQGFAEEDPRIILLYELVRDLVRSMITKRNELTERLDQDLERARTVRQVRSKQVLVKNVAAELTNTNLSSADQHKLVAGISAAFTGDPTGSDAAAFKEKSLIFISHASRDSILGDFLYRVFRELGVEEDELFYTSGAAPAPGLAGNHLYDAIRRSLVETRTLVLFITSPNFHLSENCMFEGGAAWAVKSLSAVVSLPMEHRFRLDIIHGGVTAEELVNRSGFSLNRPIYAQYVMAINKCVKFVNELRPSDKQVRYLVDDTYLHVDNSGAVLGDFLDAVDPVFRICWQDCIASESDSYGARFSDGSELYDRMMREIKDTWA